MPRSTSESPVLRACLDLLEVRGVFAWRSNNVAVFDPMIGGCRRFAGLRGVADILGVLPGGRFLAVETKRPAVPVIGQRAGTPSTAQRLFLQRVNLCGGVGLCVSDVAVLARVLDTLEADPSKVFTIDGDPLEG